MDISPHSHDENVNSLQPAVEHWCVGLMLENGGDSLCPPILVLKGAVQQDQSNVISWKMEME